MKTTNSSGRRALLAGGCCTLLCALVAFFSVRPGTVSASPFSWWRAHHGCRTNCYGFGEETFSEEVGGTWYWLRSPDEEKRVVIALFNRYCIRCHGVDGRGVWDIPDVPNYTNPHWQASRTDGQLARSILEGRGAVMPPFRGTLSLEEAFALARYVRTFVPGTEVSRPDFSTPEKSGQTGPKR
jgi:hypothetical protein